MRTTKYTKEVLAEAVANSYSFAGVLRYLGLRPAGGTAHHIAKRIRAYGIDHSHFTGKAHNRGKSSPKKLPPEQVLIVLPEGRGRLGSDRIRRALEESGIEPVCNGCGLGRNWQGKFLQLEVNHIDGDWRNCLLENLEFLCPNCHSQESSTNRPHKYRNLDFKCSQCSKPKRSEEEKCNNCNKTSRRKSTPRLKKDPAVRIKTCKCGEVITYKAKQCVKCAHADQQRIVWPEVQELLIRLRDQKESYTSIAKSLGVTDNSVRKFLRKNGIDPKTFFPIVLT